MFLAAHPKSLLPEEVHDFVVNGLKPLLDAQLVKESDDMMTERCLIHFGFEPEEMVAIGSELLSGIFARFEASEYQLSKMLCTLNTLMAKLT